MSNDLLLNVEQAKSELDLATNLMNQASVEYSRAVKAMADKYGKTKTAKQLGMSRQRVHQHINRIK